MAYANILLVSAVFLQSAIGVRINFTSCQNPEWSCMNNDIVYSCSVVRSNDFIIHLKDFYTDYITSVTVQNCKDLRIVLDCPILQRASRLQRFKIKDIERLEFVSLSNTSLLQTPPEVTIENVSEVISLPRNFFKNPSTPNEMKCLGSATLRKIRVVNTKINSINTRAIHNVGGVKSIEFDNVTIGDIQNQAIEAILGYDNTVFSILNSKIENLRHKAITVQSATTIVSENTISDVITHSINITSDTLRIIDNRFDDISGLIAKAVYVDISRNDIAVLKSNALANVKCLRKRTVRKQFKFSGNKIERVEPHSLIFDYNSCKSPGATVAFNNNYLDCTCRNIAFLNSRTSSVELNNLVLDPANNNTCLSAPCLLPVDIVKLLLESDMCQVNLDPQVMCLLYNDKQATNNEVTTDEDVTEPAPTFYLIRQANSPNGDASAAMTAINKDDLLKDSHLNMTNRTAIKVVFDSSKDFVETLRSTSTSHKRPTEEPKVQPNEEYISRCTGTQCRNNVAYDRQKALDFYKYVYAQLRPPRPNDKKKKT
ncbi:uncharacterized protein LOC115446912 [Manduca sexta]|uniref:uncharacterized protein LOC115446912 n=1 Tax=Manduca sexta TaxID=7130 RepID=UPI00188E42BA|nr:uncharacterized protein LOC115446912 [Manduca sexta]